MPAAGATGSGQAVEAGVGTTRCRCGGRCRALGEQPGGAQSAPGSGSADSSSSNSSNKVDVEQSGQQKATGSTYYEGKALIYAVAVAEWVLPLLSWLLLVVGVSVMPGVSG